MAIKHESKYKSIRHLIDKINVENLSHKAAQMGDSKQNLKGPIFTFLIGAGFSQSCGFPGTALLVAALQQFKINPRQSWDEILVTAKANPYKGSPSDATDQYFYLMDKVLKGPVGRQKFLSAVVRWAAKCAETFPINLESKLLATLLCYSTSVCNVNRFDNDESRSNDWLARRFAYHTFTTNFDEVLPTSFYLGNLPVSIIDSPSQRVVRINADFPTVVFLHGRYLHYDLRNTNEELNYEPQVYSGDCIDLISQFREVLRHTGLIVIGYSGAKDRVTKCIMKALDDPESLRYGLWWSALEEENSLHAYAQHMIKKHHRANYLEPGLNAYQLMTKLFDALGIASFDASEKWISRIDTLKVKYEYQRVEDFHNHVEAAVRRDSRPESSQGLIDAWHTELKQVVEACKAPEKIADIKRYVGILMLHLGSQKIGVGAEDANMLNEGMLLVEESIRSHQELKDVESEAWDYLHLGAYQSKRNEFEKRILTDVGREELYHEAEESIVKAKNIFADAKNDLRVFECEFWLARLELNLGDKQTGLELMIGIANKSYGEYLPIAFRALEFTFVEITDS